MTTEIMMFECPKCHKFISLDGAPKFCTSCGFKLENKDIKTITRPMCPPEIEKGHCDECKEGKHKKCDDCGRTEEVKYCPQWEDRCLCTFCREREATFDCLRRSW